ncbi:phosphotriesterase [candidate division KSB1 bacterium]|nr:phosphotriesterase [candidate division KSB1 bacterium]
MILITSLFVTGCVQKKQIIMTVSGPLPAQDMGTTLAHEHFLVDFIGAGSTGYHRWDRNKVEERVLPYLMDIKDYGVKTLVECTPAYLGRDPLLLKSLSRKSGINILTNTGFYGARDNIFIPNFAFAESAEQLADRWINEWEEGLEGTGIKPGFIKIAVDAGDTLSVMHAKLIRAAALTHLATGLTIMSHTGPEKPFFNQLDILEQEGVAPEAFIWTHAQRGTRTSHIEAAKQGVWVSLDNVFPDSARIGEYVDMLVNLKQNNLLHRVLLSHDAGWYHVGEPNGGNFREFIILFKILIPALSNNGFTDQDIRQILVINPQKAFTIKVRRINNM